MGFFEDEKNDESIEWQMDEEDQVEESDIPDESPIRDLDPEFKKSLATAKHRIFEETILRPDEHSPDAQDLKLLSEYQLFIQVFYLLSLRARKGELISSADISFFPESSRKIVEAVLHWMHTFFKNNEPKDTAIYSHYIDMMLKDMPFYQEEGNDLLLDNSSIRTE